MKTQAIELSKLRTDGGTQAREEISNETVREYAVACEAGDSFPPIDVFYDGSTYWIADGFHRFYGHRDAKRKTIECIVHQGTVRDAILFAVGANRTNGLRRTNADKRRAVMILLEDEEWGQWSDRAMAEKAGVSNTSVGEYRRQYEASKAPQVSKFDTCEEPKPPQKRKGKDGKLQSATKKKPKPANECPRGGKHEPDEDGDCAKCLEPGIGKADERTRFDVPAIEAAQAADKAALSSGETVKASGDPKLSGAARAKAFEKMLAAIKGIGKQSYEIGGVPKSWAAAWQLLKDETSKWSR